MSIEKYFYEKWGIPRTHKTAYGYSYPDPRIDFNATFGGPGHTLQHIPFSLIEKRGTELFDVDWTDLVLLATVRNPYHRIVSDLFFFIQYTGITRNSTPQDVEKAIYHYLTNETYDYDNHRLPQWKMLVRGRDGKIPPEMIILKTESLTEEMHQMGFTDFSFHENPNRTGEKIDYMSLFTPRSIEMVNLYYEKDFELFHYSML